MVVLKRGFHSVIFFVLFLTLAISKSTDGIRKTLERSIQTRHGLDEENTAFLKAFDHLTKSIPRSDSKSSFSINQKPLSCLGGEYSVDRFPSRSGRRYLTYTISQSAYRTRPRTRARGAPLRVISDAAAPSPAESPRYSAPVYSPEDAYLPIGMFELAPVPPLQRPSSFSTPPATALSSPVEGKGEVTRIMVLIGTGAGVFVALAALLLCCLAAGGKGRNGNKDDKPLLALSSTTYSGGSSGNSSLKLSSSGSKEVNRRDGQVSSNYLGNQEQVSEATARAGVPRPETPPSGKDLPEPEPPQPPPPPPPRAAPPPPAPPKAVPGKIPSNAPKPQRKAQSSDDESGSQKAKLKPFFWDKTVLTNTDQSMVWNEIRSGSFQFNEEMIERLFGYSSSCEKNKSHGKKDSSGSESAQYIQILEAKKAQNLAILLRALNVTTEEVVDALRRGNELPVDLIQILLKVAPTTEEELKLRLFSGDPSQLGPAERFLKVVVDIPYAFQRLDSLLFMCSFEEESSTITESLTTLEVACNKVRSSRLFLKLLEAVLKTGNRMNDGTYRGGAQAFRLDTLLKLADVKGTDGKTTLLHFVVKEIIRSEGDRALRSASMPPSPENSRHGSALGLAVVSGLSDELEDVRRAAAVDADAVAATVARLGASLARTRKFLDREMSNVVVVEEGSEFSEALAGFVSRAEVDVAGLAEREKRTMALVKSTTDYFHGSAAGKDEGLRLFVIVRDFLVMVDKVCREVRASESARPVARGSTSSVAMAAGNVCGSSSESVHSLSDFRQRLFPAIAGRRVEDDSCSSSDDEY